MIDLIITSVLAGIFIALGGIAYLSVTGILGSILFSFGLLSVIHYKLPLFTGRSGFCSDLNDLKRLPIILLGNIIGASLIGIVSNITLPDISTQASYIVENKMSVCPLPALFKSMCCGIIMTTIVSAMSDNKYVFVILGIPLFILSGFWHSIADIFYYTASLNINLNILYLYPITILGNFIGCVAINIFKNRSIFSSKM